jgi:hypothetical protein
LLALALSVASTTIAAGQADRAPAPPPEGLSPNQGAVCPPDVRGTPPTVGGPATENLTEKLEASKGVICPPAGIDPELHIRPPADGDIKVIPPPGSPGGDPRLQPK